MTELKSRPHLKAEAAIKEFGGSEDKITSDDLAVNLPTAVGLPDPDVAGLAVLGPVLPICEEHLAELASSAIPVSVALAHGVHTAHSVEELPEWARWITAGEDPFPALVYPMVEADGSPTGQVKPRTGSVTDREGRVLKYVSPSDKGDSPHAPLFPLVRAVEKPEGVLIVEGVKQALAVDAWGPEGWAIHRICGVSGWSRKGVPTHHLKAVNGHPVVIVVDADASANRGVYEAAEALGDACRQRGATSVAYLKVAGFGTAGIDDLLGNEPDAADRRELLSQMIASAGGKPADSKPRAVNKASDGLRRALIDARAGDPRPLIHVHEDRQKVIDQVSSALKKRFDGKILFCHAKTLGVLVETSEGLQIEHLDEGTFSDLVSKAALTVSGLELEDKTEGCVHPPAWPETRTLGAVLSRHAQYTPLKGVARTPLVRADGSVVTQEGYDPQTGFYVSLAPELRGIAVPENPTDADIAAARSLLVDDLFVDFLFAARCDLANAIGALLTPLIRSWISTSPAMVFNGQQPGVGKGLGLKVMSVVTTGTSPEFAMLPTDEDEMRKALTAYFLAGATTVFFDEAHVLDSAVLNGALTADSWSDRKLGASERVAMPQRAVFYFTGNAVEISGDTARRVVQIRLSTDDPEPENRSGFKHRLPQWAEENRAELLRACLVLVRAWFARGKPRAPRTFDFGSFEKWQQVIGGILDVAGIPGFLEGIVEQRAGSDFQHQYWVAHLGWVAETFGVGVEFSARDAALRLTRDKGAEAPPGLERLTKEEDARSLGRAWASQPGRWRGDFRIVSSGTGAGGSKKWVIEKRGVPSGSVTLSTLR